MAIIRICDICSKQLPDESHYILHTFLQFTHSSRIKTLKRIDICAECINKLDEAISTMTARSANEVNYSFTYQDDSTFLDND